MQNARENPLSAAAVAAAVRGGQAPAQSNTENLLDIDFDGAAPASIQKAPASGMSGLEGLAGTPQRVASPMSHNGPSKLSNLDDLLSMDDMSSNNDTGGYSGGLADLGGLSQGNQGILDGFGSLDLAASTQPPPPQQQLAGSSAGKSSGDLLDLL